jgi:hypothetical protein
VAVDEAIWLFCTDPTPMLQFLRRKASDRKLRLFAVACCRRVWHLLTDKQSRKVVDLVEGLADQKGMTERDLHDWGWMRETKEAWCLAEFHAWAAAERTAGSIVGRVIASARETDGEKARLWEGTVRRALDDGHPPAEAVAAGNAAVVNAAEWFARIADAERAEQSAQCQLLRHIIGNPFRPYPAPPSWPSTVVQLAESLYAGQDCAFALHDALLDAGHAELAEHFREEQQHPKGCWVLDLLLGKE